MPPDTLGPSTLPLAPLATRPVFALGSDRLTPVHLELMQSLPNPGEPMLEFNPFTQMIAESVFLRVGGHREDAQHQPAFCMSAA